MTDEEPQEASNEEAQEAENSEPQVSQSKQRALDHGWKEHQDYIDNGGDPDMWRGSKAFNDHYDQKQSSREKLNKMEGTIERLATNFTKSQEQQNKKHKSELESALKQAEEDLDITKFKEVQKELNDIDETPPTPVSEHDSIQKFRSQNPHIDKASSSFNPSMNAAIESMANNKIVELTNQYGRGLSDMELNTVLNDSLNAVKTDFPNLFTNRKVKTPPKQANIDNKKTSTKDPMQGLDEISVAIYKDLKDTNPKAAAVFIKNIGANND